VKHQGSFKLIGTQTVNQCIHCLLLQDNMTLQNKRQGEKLFPTDSKLREIVLIVEAKGDNLFTTEVFEEMR